MIRSQPGGVPAALPDEEEELACRIHGSLSLPRLIYLPGVHGDWSFIGRFRSAIAGRACLIEFSYPETTRWSLADYSAAIFAALDERGIHSGFLLAESFGSQVAWAMLPHGTSGSGPRTVENSCMIQGMILAGGFVRHPFMPGVRAAETLLRHTPVWLIRLVFRLYRLGWCVAQRWNLEESQSVKERLIRCTVADRSAIVHRLRLIRENDPRPVAAAARLPVFQLSGGFDPIVPAPPVRRWLKMNCPGFVQARTLALADHNVLGTGSIRAADQIMAWITGISSACSES